MVKVILIQPAIPEYRRGFLRCLSQSDEIRLISYASERVGGSPDTAQLAEYDVVTSLKELSFFGFLYQVGLPYREMARADVVVTCGNPRYLSNYISLFFCKVVSTKVISWGQGWSANTSRLSYFFKILTYRLFDAVILYTEKEMIDMRETPFSPKNLFFLNNGLDLPNVCLQNQTKSTEACLNLIFLGRLTEKANFDLLLKALLKTSVPFLLDVIGDGKYLSKFQDDVKKFGLEEKVSFRGAIFDEKKISFFMKRAHFFVYPGSVGLSLIHAFSYGVPAIIHSNERKHMPEACAFSDKINGVSFDQGSASSLSSAIDLAYKLTLSGRDAEMGASGRELVERKFNTSFMARQFVDAVTSVLDAS